MRRLCLALIFVSVALGSAIAQTDDRTQAAEHFALAQSAEARSDWGAAIAEYEKAHRLAPHPSVLFNIAVDYERLGERRPAVRYFQRYLDGSPAAEDRAEVLRRIASLRQAASTVWFTANPADATIVVDGRAIGTAPLTTTLDPGGYQIVAEHGGHRSIARKIVLEYGEPVNVAIDLFALPGLLTVSANIEGAEVRIDGALAGQTPFSAQIASGEHKVLVSLAGYQTVQRDVSVPPQGSAQVSASLQEIPGVQRVPQPVSPGRAGKFVIGSAYGLQLGSDDGLRYTVDLAYRTSNNRLEIGALYGSFGTDLGAGLGIAGRGFLATSRVRPYLRGAVLLTESRVVEGGLGLLIAGIERQPGSYIGLEYFAEIDFQLRDGGRLADDGPGSDPLPRAAVQALGTVIVPLVIGISIRLGG